MSILINDFNEASDEGKSDMFEEMIERDIDDRLEISQLRAELAAAQEEAQRTRELLEDEQINGEAMLYHIRRARVALTFYAKWMIDHSNGTNCTYPYGAEVEAQIRNFDATEQPQRTAGATREDGTK